MREDTDFGGQGCKTDQQWISSFLFGSVRIKKKNSSLTLNRAVSLIVFKWVLASFSGEELMTKSNGPLSVRSNRSQPWGLSGAAGQPCTLLEACCHSRKFVWKSSTLEAFQMFLYCLTCDTVLRKHKISTNSKWCLSQVLAHFTKYLA